MERNILIILSPKEYPEQLCTLLKDYGFFTTLVRTVDAAFEYLKTHRYEFMLVDLGLEDALSFLKEVVATFYDPPPYILAANTFNCSLEQAEILNLGADTCLDKPLNFEEVIAVINAVLRRADRLAHPKPIHPASQIRHGDLVIDPMRRSVSIEGRLVTLTVKEFDILSFLADHPDVVFSKEQIYERVWNEECVYVSTNVADHISAIRQKLGLSPKDGRYIQTVYGAGYRFVEPE